MENKEELKKMSKEMPGQAVRQMEVVLKRMYAEENVPYDVSHLKASLQTCHLILPNLPPVYAQFISSAVLLLYRLIEELETGEIASPFVMPKKNE